MKKILLFLLPAMLLLASCRRQDYGPNQPIDETYWLSKERGVVNYSDGYCDYFVVETYSGFSVLKSWGGYPPVEGAVLYGDLSRPGVHTIYNRSEGYLLQAEVTDYWLTYWDAIDQVNWFCSK